MANIGRVEGMRISDFLKKGVIKGLKAEKL
jgi:hypothetical protein